MAGERSCPCAPAGVVCWWASPAPPWSSCSPRCSCSASASRRISRRVPISLRYSVSDRHARSSATERNRRDATSTPSPGATPTFSGPAPRRRRGHHHARPPAPRRRQCHRHATPHDLPTPVHDRHRGPTATPASLSVTPTDVDAVERASPSPTTITVSNTGGSPMMWSMRIPVSTRPPSQSRRHPGATGSTDPSDDHVECACYQHNDDHVHGHRSITPVTVTVTCT